MAGEDRIMLGTRGSELALAQTAMVRGALGAAVPSLAVEHRVISTSGDRRQDLKLHQFAEIEGGPVDKGIFTKELEVALEAGEVDAAVHSLKDVPTELADGFSIAAVLPRAPVEDVLVSKFPGGLDGLPPGAVVATSSVRRAALLRHLRPDLGVEDIRGNVQTRLRKLADNPGWAATVLAKAGLVRLGFDLDQGTLEPSGGVTFAAAVLDPERFLPAAGQGAVGIEVFRPRAVVAGALAAVDHPETMVRVRAERHFLHLLGAGCQTPVGALTRVAGGRLGFRAIVFGEGNGAGVRATEVDGDAGDPESVAELAFRSLAPE